MAPSVRVKTGDYAQIHDTPVPRNRRPSVLELFTPGSSPPNLPSTFLSTSPPAASSGLHATIDDSNSPPRRGRSRGISVSQSLHSKISHHVLSETSNKGSRRNGTAARRRGQHESQSSLARSHLSSPLHSQDENGMMTLEGSQADVVVAADSENPGRIGSALSFASEDAVHSIHSDDEEEDEYHHHDDIVEHLDAIGTSLSLSYSVRCLLIIFSLDPQVQTVSDLTNVANSILMCVASDFSIPPQTRLTHVIKLAHHYQSTPANPSWCYLHLRPPRRRIWRTKLKASRIAAWIGTWTTC